MRFCMNEQETRYNTVSYSGDYSRFVGTSATLPRFLGLSRPMWSEVGKNRQKIKNVLRTYFSRALPSWLAANSLAIVIKNNEEFKKTQEKDKNHGNVKTRYS